MRKVLIFHVFKMGDESVLTSCSFPGYSNETATRKHVLIRKITYKPLWTCVRHQNLHAKPLFCNFRCSSWTGRASKIGPVKLKISIVHNTKITIFFENFLFLKGTTWSCSSNRSEQLSLSWCNKNLFAVSSTVATLENCLAWVTQKPHAAEKTKLFHEGRGQYFLNI